MIHSTREGDPLATYQQYVVVQEAFAKQHPAIVKRVVRAIVRTAQRGSDERLRNDTIRL